MATKYLKLPVEQHLNLTDYEMKGYMPTVEALMFVNFIKEVNNGQEENETPLVHLKMMDNVFNNDKRCAILCHRGIGKLETENSPILTPGGWTTMGAISVGDSVIDRHGKATVVTYKTEAQYPETYLMTLTDGTTMEVGDEHKHVVWRDRRTPTVKRNSEKVMTTLELIESGLVTTSKRSSVKDSKCSYRFGIPLVSPIEFSYKPVGIDPYVLGLGLANGYYPKGQISCHADDMVELCKYVGDSGYSINSMRIEGGNSGQMYIGSKVFSEYSELRSDNKYIPKEYMLGSIDQRVLLLRGLMDGDGHIAKNGGCSYSSYNRRLATDVRDLARSLGAISYVKEYIRSDKNFETEYRTIVNIKVNPFRLNRKASKWRPTKKMTKGIVSLEPLGKKKGYCIEVSSESHTYIANGYTVTHNTTVFAEYLILFCAAFGYIPGFGKTNLILYITDSIENGVKNLRRNVEFRYANSEFLQKLIPDKKISVGDNGGYVDPDEYERQSGGGRKFTDIRLEFKNNKGHTTIVKGYGAKALSLSSTLHTDLGTVSIEQCKVGDRIFGADGKLATIVEKSEIFYKPMYQILLEDGRSLSVSEDHINSIVHKENVNNRATYSNKDLYTSELLELPLVHSRKRTRKSGADYTSNENLLFIENCKPLEYSEKTFDVEPYTLGLILGDGSIKASCNTVVITGHKDDWVEYEKNIPYPLGKVQVDKRNANVVTRTIKGIGSMVKCKGLGHGNSKFVPSNYFLGSIEQRLAILRGLLDSDGSIQKNGRMDFCSNSEVLVDDVSDLVNSLGGTTKKRVVKDAYRIEIWMELNPFKLTRKANRFNGRSKNLVAITSIERIEDEPSQCIAIDNESHQFVTEGYVRTHNTGVRGAKEMGQRPTMAILDDLVSDTDAESPTIIATIENTVYKAVSKALSPTKQKMIWLGTPFNARDPLYKAVESGAWRVSVYPICEEFPVEKKDFRGSWEDRFTYEYVRDEYEEAQALGMPANFNQELMLRIMSEEDRLVKDSDIRWYDSSIIDDNKANYNFYITTDFATSEKQAADFSVISVWAYTNNGDWLWVDGTIKRQLMDQTMNDVFRFVTMYKPEKVGIEVSGQQGGFMKWIEDLMLQRNIFFNLASDKNSGEPGIRPNGNKMIRFQTILPQFKLKKIRFPEDQKDSEEVREIINELSNASKSGFKSKHDDFIDTVSMLSVMDPWKPSEGTTVSVDKEDGIYKSDYVPESEDSSYDVI